MKAWIYDKSADQGAHGPSLHMLPAGKQTTEGRNSDDFAKDSRPDLTDAQLDAMERSEANPLESHRLSSVPRSLLSTDPSPSGDLTPPKRTTSGTVRGGLSHLAHATANAVERYMLGSDSDDDVKLPKIDKSDRYAGVRERQEMFMNDANARADGHEPAMSPFERYRTRMGERTGSSGEVEERLAAQEDIAGLSKPSPNRVASPARNRSVDTMDRRRLLVSDTPLRIAPAESKPSGEIAATQGSLNGVKPTQVPRGSFEVSEAGAVHARLRRLDATRITDTTRETPITDSRAPIRTPLHSIEEGRSTQQTTRVQNLRVVQPRYLIPREVVYGFGTATILGLVIGCVTLAIGIRNLNYLRGPHASSLFPDLQAEVGNLTRAVNAIASAQGVNVGLRHLR